MTTQVGVIGLGTMGSALARNLASRGFKVSVWNRSKEKVTQFVNDFGENSFYASENFEDFVESLERPRRIILMVPAGDATQEMVDHLSLALEAGDAVMDGGNSFFKDSEAVEKELIKNGIHFLGCGVSGGEEGAMFGPSLMPGGNFDAWQDFEPLLSAISAEDFTGRACVSYMGKGGAGHFVKMVHNGIEYAEMQALSEAYFMLKQLYRLSNPEIAEIFRTWDYSHLASYLTEISVEVLLKEEDGKPLLDLILDKAGQKGTGQWTAQEALELGVFAPSLANAVFARNASADKEGRLEMEEIFPVAAEPPRLLLSEFVEHLEAALMLTRLSNFEQGLMLMKAADKKYGFSLVFPEIFRVWQGGCIIRNQMLAPMSEILKSGESGFYASEWGKEMLNEGISSWTLVAETAVRRHIPLFAISSALNHFEAARSAFLPANFLQGLRDKFGAHGYQRVDLPGTFNSDWQ